MTGELTKSSKLITHNFSTMITQPFAFPGVDMPHLIRAAALAMVLPVFGACNGAAPREAETTTAVAASGHRDSLESLRELCREDGKAALAQLEAYVAKHPAEWEGHDALTDCLTTPDFIFGAEHVAMLERALIHGRKAIELADPGMLRNAMRIRLAGIYEALERPADVIQTANEVIAEGSVLGEPHKYLALALADLGRLDEAVLVWREAEKTIVGMYRRDIARGVRALVAETRLTDAQVAILVDVLTRVAADRHNPDPLAHAVLLKLVAERQTKDPATKRQLLEAAASWDALADRAGLMAFEELKALADGGELKSLEDFRPVLAGRGRR